MADKAEKCTCGGLIQHIITGETGAIEARRCLECGFWQRPGTDGWVGTIPPGSALYDLHEVLGSVQGWLAHLECRIMALEKEIKEVEHA